jgi:alanine racemase
MAVTLYVDRAAWLAHVEETWRLHPGLIPVVKGNGYGLGRDRLAALAVERGADAIAVGTVHELASVPSGVTAVVLTPALAPELADVDPAGVQLTVGGRRHVDEARAAGWRGAVVVKLASDLRRFGTSPEELDGLHAAIDEAGLAVAAHALHFPLATSSAEHAAQATSWLAVLGGAPSSGPLELQVSHVEPEDLAVLAARHPHVRLRPRVGTRLWHGDKRWFALRADVLDVRPVGAGERAGYRLTEQPAEGHLVVASGGTAHGVQPLPDGRSPYHFARTRLALVEPPHMHTSLLFVAAGEPLPGIGDELDLQRPLTQVNPDRIVDRA